MTCDHQNFEFLYISLVEDGIDMVVKCKKCGQHIIFKGGYIIEEKRTFDSDAIIEKNLEEMKRQTKYVEIPPRFGVPEDE